MTLVAALFLTGTIFYVSNSVKKFKTYPKAEAVITEINVYGSGDNEKHEVYISYKTAAGQKIDTQLSYYSSSMKTGDVMEVYYNPDKPGEPETRTGFIFAVVILSFFTLITVAAAILMDIQVGRIFWFKHSKSNLRIAATVKAIGKISEVNAALGIIEKVGVRLDDEFSLGQTIAAQDGDGRIYKSKLITDPLKLSPGDSINVYVNIKDPQKYYVDYKPFLNNKWRWVYRS